jgi:GNAT superfamily N-acetyltransferase
MLDQDESDSLRIAWAESDADISACLPVLREFWPQIGSQGDFVASVRGLQERGYRLLAAWFRHHVIACAGYQLEENLISGRYLHVSELVTTERMRSRGIGERLLDKLFEEARKFDCQALMLECGLRNSRAHRFYFREGLRIIAFRFAVPLEFGPQQND